MKGIFAISPYLLVVSVVRLVPKAKPKESRKEKATWVI